MVSGGCKVDMRAVGAHLQSTLVASFTLNLSQPYKDLKSGLAMDNSHLLNFKLTLNNLNPPTRMSTLDQFHDTPQQERIRMGG